MKLFIKWDKQMADSRQNRKIKFLVSIVFEKWRVKFISTCCHLPCWLSLVSIYTCICHYVTTWNFQLSKTNKCRGDCNVCLHTLTWLSDHLHWCDCRCHAPSHRDPPVCSRLQAYIAGVSPPWSNQGLQFLLCHWWG